MTFLTSTPVQAISDESLSDLLAHWITEQFQHDVPAKRERPSLGIMAASGTRRDGGWPVYGGDAPITHANLEAGGFPSSIPPLPFLEGSDPSYLLHDDHTFAQFFDLLWPVALRLDGLVFSGGGDLSGCLSGQQPHSQAETADLWRDLWERFLTILGWLLCIPTLGICRGMHLMNVALGGTISQDLRTPWPTDRPPLVRHRSRKKVSSSHWVTHPVQLTRSDSRLALAVKGRGEPGRLALDAVLSILLALGGCFPLLVLDFLPLGRRPLPIPGGRAACWIKRYWTIDRWHLQLDERVVSRNWWRSFLDDRSQTSRGDLPLTLLASGVVIMLGGVWGAVPTPFAAGLSGSHTLEKLDWLLGGQLGSLASGTCFLVCATRGVIGFSHRLLPTAWQPRLRSLMLVMPLGMAGSLVAVGLPFLQAPWWLAMSLGSYTLADAIWSLLFPRLRPDLGTRVLSRRHLQPGQSVGWLNPVRLAYGRGCEARANRQRATIAGVLIAAMTPVVGWVIDWRGGVDEALIIVGLIFFPSLACALGGHALLEMTRRPSLGRSGLIFYGMCSRSSVLPHMKTSHSLKGN